MGFGKAQKKLRNKEIRDAEIRKQHEKNLNEKNLNEIDNLDDNRIYITKELGRMSGKQLKDYQRSYKNSN